MDVWAIVPVKSLLESKGRLAHLLSSEERAQLVRGLLHHLLKAVQETPRITRLLVISSDPEVRQIAAAYDALTVEEKPPFGLNSAVSSAYNLAAEGGASAVLILPADLPFVTTADLDLMIDAGLGSDSGNGTDAAAAESERPVMAICSDRRGDGTNALFMRPCLDFYFHYGPNSLQRHVHEAVEHDYLVRFMNSPALQFDLDTEEDWQTFQAQNRSQSINNSAVQQFGQ